MPWEEGREEEGEGGGRRWRDVFRENRRNTETCYTSVQRDSIGPDDSISQVNLKYLKYLILGVRTHSNN